MSDPDVSGMDPQARRFLAMVAVGANEVAHVSAEERRRSFERLMRFSKPPAAALETQDHLVASCGADIPLRAYAPSGTPGALPGLVYFHGGGLVAGTIETHDALCRTLAHEAGCRILSVGYRLAPEHPFPAAIIDGLRVMRWVVGNATSLGLTSVSVGGDSGGGTLAAIICQILRNRIRIKAQVLLCPVLDFSVRHGSRQAFAKGFLLDATTMERDLAHYTPHRPLGDPRISPLNAPALGGLPHTLIHTAAFDPLHDEGAAYATRLRDAGVTVDYVCHETLIHHFYGLTTAIPAARTALSAIAADIGRVLA